MVLGITRGEAADKFLEHGPKAMGAKTGFSQAVDMARILGTELRCIFGKVEHSVHILFTTQHNELGDSFLLV